MVSLRTAISSTQRKNFLTAKFLLLAFLAFIQIANLQMVVVNPQIYAHSPQL